MFKRLALVALSTAVVTSPAQANQLKDYIYANPVLSVVHESGTKIFFQGETCSDAYGSYSFEKDEMTICLENHSDYAELGDTIRHEAVHVIQNCNRGPVMSMLDTAKYATPADKAFAENYPHARQHMELEANIAARNLNDEEVASLVYKFCFE